jgi:hypothetical protein
MGKKLLVSLAMEGKFSSEGLQAINEEDDILMGPDSCKPFPCPAHQVAAKS